VLFCGKKTKPIKANFRPTIGKTVEDGHEMGIIRRKQVLYEIEVKYAIESS
jgi:hypothetical protein